MPEVVPIIPEQELVPRAARGLSSHVRQFRKRNQGLSRWIALAVGGGVGVRSTCDPLIYATKYSYVVLRFRSKQSQYLFFRIPLSELQGSVLLSRQCPAE